MTEFSQRRPVLPAQRRNSAQSQQPRKLLAALVLLLVALAVLLIKDRDFWFGTEQATIESDMPATQAASQPAPGARQVPATAKKQLPAMKIQEPAKPADNSATISRTVLPPLDVEVVAGQTHKRVHPGNGVKVQVAAPEPAPTEEISAATNAAEREPVTPPVQAEEKPYPALAQHMNVQGSVVLQAVISTAGQIEDLKVLSGPGILASAARQAVMEWRFKPMFQNGQAVESKAKITVNFSIRVADGSEKMTLAESRSNDSLIITR
jgi:periplasmic protein TonB